MDDHRPHASASARADPKISRRMRVDHWRHMSDTERDAFTAHVLVDPTTEAPNVTVPCNTRDASEVVRLLGDVAMAGHIVGFSLQFDLLPHAWSVFVEAPVCRGLTVQEHTVGDTFCQAVVMALLRVYDVDFVVGVDDNATGTPGERRAVNALLKRVPHVLTDDLPDGWYDDLVRSFGRVRRPQDMTAYDLTLWMYAALARLRATNTGLASDERL